MIVSVLILRVAKRLLKIFDVFDVKLARLLEFVDIVVEISILFIEIDDVLILPLTSNLFKGFVEPIPIFPLFKIVILAKLIETLDWVVVSSARQKWRFALFQLFKFSAIIAVFIGAVELDCVPNKILALFNSFEFLINRSPLKISNFLNGLSVPIPIFPIEPIINLLDEFV